MGEKVGFAAVFTDITRRGALPENASIHTPKMNAIKVALKEIHKREDKRWLIYTGSHSPMHSIEYNKENHLILNQIHEILAKIQTEDE